MEELSLAQYVMINWTYGHSLVSMRRGNRSVSSSFIDINIVMSSYVYSTQFISRSVIFVQFTFQRTLGFYFLQIYIPLTIIVMSSWVSFWLVKTSQVPLLQLDIY